MKRRFLKFCAVITGMLVLTCLYKLVFIAGADMVIRYGLAGFIMISPKGINDRAVLDSDDKVSMIKNGRLSKIMNCPKNGSCEYVYFTDRW